MEKRSLPALLQVLLDQMPEMSREQRLELVEQLEQDCRWSIDFGVMMGLAAALATLGLLQGAPAVVIGAMLVAPLMTPLIGAGFALVQGNVKLFRQAVGTTLTGTAMGLALSLIIGAAVPQREISLEILARTSPTLIDLLVAFLSGVAAAYAIARPNVVAAVAGVAIAAALVPPLATIGIGLSRGNMWVAQGASLLLVTNLVAIILGSATVFRLMNVRRAKLVLWSTSWVHRAVLTLIVLSIILLAPLGMSFSRQLATGQTRPMAFPVASKLHREINALIDEYEGVELMLAGRPASDDDEADVIVYLTTSETAPLSLIQRLDEAVRHYHGGKANVFIVPLKTAEVTIGDHEVTTDEASETLDNINDMTDEELGDDG